MTIENIEEIEKLVDALPVLHQKKIRIQKRIKSNDEYIRELKLKSNTESVYNYIKANSGKVTKEQVIDMCYDENIAGEVIYDLLKADKIEWNGVAYSTNVEAIRSIEEKMREIEKTICKSDYDYKSRLWR